MTDYGAFIDLGDMDSLCHASDLGWARISHPSEVLKIDQKIKVKVIKIDPTKNRVSVGIRQLQEDPWNTVKTKYKVGDKVKYLISNVQTYGVFIEISIGSKDSASKTI